MPQADRGEKKHARSEDYYQACRWKSHNPTARQVKSQEVDGLSGLLYVSHFFSALFRKTDSSDQVRKQIRFTSNRGFNLPLLQIKFHSMRSTQNRPFHVCVYRQDRL
jgi:hypothetical protein